MPSCKQILAQARESLSQKQDIEDPALESEVLLRHILNIDRVQLRLEQARELDPEKAEQFWELVKRRLQDEPLAYIVQCREFFGLDFYVDRRVLIPRPETEHLVEEALRFAKEHAVSAIADIGAGSGAIAISLAINLFPPDLSSLQASSHNATRVLSPSGNTSTPPSSSFPFSSPLVGKESKVKGIIPNKMNGQQSRGVSSLRGAERLKRSDAIPPPKIYATDISPSALEVALINCRKHNVEDRIALLQGDLLDPLPEPVDIITANLPYVKNVDVQQMPSAKFEPVSALMGGEQGLDQIFRLGRQLNGKLKPGGCLLMEIGLGKSQVVGDFFHSLFHFSSIEFIRDLAGIERVVKVITN